MRDRVTAGHQPWLADWKRLLANPHSAASWRPRPLPVIYRGTGTPENYSILYKDIHAAYQNALRYHISGNTAHGDAARHILNSWSDKLTRITGNNDRILAAGLYGYQMANAGELVRDYPDFALGRFKKMLANVFYPLCRSFLSNHAGAYIGNYWANWDLCTMASVLAIGIFLDDAAKVDEAISYFKNGAGWGSILHAVQFVHPGGMGQWQESGRDQGHTILGIGLMGGICQMAWNQGHDLYGYAGNRFFTGCEYVARYNLGHAVPFTPFTMHFGVPGSAGRYQRVSAPSTIHRGTLRPVWEMAYNHYHHLRGLPMPYTAAMAAKMRPDGGGGNYGEVNAGYDQFGFGALTYTL